jgi:L-iditol 2-dehydrogenase
MLALMKTKSGFGNVELQNIEVPDVKSNDVLIKVAYSGICGTDLHIYHGTYDYDPPVVLGHEFSGVVVKTGPEVKKLREGDKVTVLPSIGKTCMQCIYCKNGFYMLCSERKSLGSGLNGSFTEFVSVREDMVYKLPDYVSLKEAALAEPLACAVQAVEELTEIHFNDSVLVSGPGPIGLLCVSLLVSKGCNVIVTGTSADHKRLKIAKELGAQYIIDVEKQPIQDLVNSITDGNGVDVVLECSGAGLAVKTGLQSLKKQGKYIQVGIFENAVQLDMNLIIYKQLQVYGSFAHSMKTWERVQRIISDQKLNLATIITHTMPLYEWKSAFELCESKSCGKVLLYYKK